MAIGKFLNPKNDYAFKQIFATERNKGILLHFLNDIFANILPPIESVTLLSPYNNPLHDTDRPSTVDVRCEDSRGRHFIIEMQLANEGGFLQRIQYYTARTYVEQRKKGVDYPDLQPVTSLVIANFVLFKDHERFLSHHYTVDGATGSKSLEAMSYSFLELPKFTNTIDQLHNLIDKWVYFLKHAEDTSERDLQTIIGTDLIIKQAYDELDRFGWSDAQLDDYEHAEMGLAKAKGMANFAHAEGRAEGEEAATLAIAHRLIKADAPDDYIMAITGLPQHAVALLRTTVA